MAQHTTVLLHEAVEALTLTPTATVVDATFGAGGHANAILSQLGKGGTFIGIDADQTALDSAELVETDARVHLENDNFCHIKNILSSLQIEKVNGVLADLGWRMDQFAGNGKGFSFQHDEPLIMTYGDASDYDFTARDIVNEWDEHVLADIFFGYAQERFSRRIAKVIVESREITPIETSLQLAALVKKAIPVFGRKHRIHPATKVFQALRIAVNNEFGVLETFIADAFAALAPEGRLAIITFHSLEDRVVKHTFREMAAAELGKLITKKPISPSAEEIAENLRSRSAKLRIIQKN